jgi:hypothetical protein
MKKKIIYLILPVLLLSCSKKPGPVSVHQPQDQQASTLTGCPFQIVVVETPQTKEIKDISGQVAILFAAKDYDRLNALVAGFQASKERYANGGWKLDAAYKGLSVPEDASNAEWEKRLTDLRAWIQAEPDSIIPRVALADNLTSYAWKARGGGLVDSVTDEGMRLFSQRLNQAAQVLAEAGEFKDKSPEYWSAVMTTAIGMQLDKNRFNNIFERAIGQFPDYEGFYAKRALYLLPRWYGEEGEWQSDLAQSADKIAGEDGDMLYAQVVWYVDAYGEVSKALKANNLPWERVEKGFDVIQKRYPDSLAAISKRSMIAAEGNHRNEATKYFEMTKGQFDPTAWNTRGGYNDLTNWLYGIVTR